jgi:ribosomal protein L37AE/L43A
VTLLQSKPEAPFMPMLVLLVAAVGLAAGLGSRLALVGRSGALQVLAAAAAVVLGLFGLGALTGWRVGLGPVEFWRDEIEFFELAQVLTATLASTLVLSAWRRPRSGRRSRPRVVTSQHVSEPGGEYSTDQARRGRGRGLVALVASTPHPQRRDRTGAAGRATHGRPMIRRLNLRSAAPVVHAPRRGNRRRRPDVQLSRYAEHKCPFCLEDVHRNDARGVEECRICHTLHHADCWQVTGMCQVPHMSG